MTTFVDTSVLLSGPEAADNDPIVVVVRSAMPMFREAGESAALAFELDFRAKYESDDFSGVFDLLLGQAEIIFAKVANVADPEMLLRVAKTAEGYFEVVLSILSKLDSIEGVSDRVDKFINTVACCENSGLKLRLLVTLMNLFSPKTFLRHKVVNALCVCGVSAAPFVLQCDSWAVHWEIPSAEKAAMFVRVASICEGDDKIKFLKLAARLQTDLAELLLLEAIKLPEFVRFVELSDFKSNNSQITKCIEIFESGTIADMETFCANGGVSGVEGLVDKMRVIALAAGGPRRVTLTDPTLVIRALQLGVIKGAIDSVKGFVEITAVLPRTRKELETIVNAL